MLPQGHLSIGYSPDAGRVDWHWHSNREHGERIWQKRLSSTEFQTVLDQTYADWDMILAETCNGQFAKAREHLRITRARLTAAIAPDDLAWDMLGSPGTTITVAVAPDEIPIEIVEVGDLPFGVRYKALHTKRRDDVPLHPAEPFAGRQWSDVPRAHMSIMPNVLSPSSQAIREHAIKILESLTTLFGGQNVEYVGNGCPAGHSICCEEMLQRLGDDDFSCCYHFGHGDRRNHSGLCLADGALYADEIYRYTLQRGKRRSGFAFINSCWSAASGARGGLDVTRALLEGGWLAALGTILNPLSMQGIAFANRFFSTLPTVRCELLAAHHAAVLDAWSRYRAILHDGDLSWACYRLYGLPGLGVLRSRATNVDGSVLWNINDQSVVLVDPTDRDQDSLPAEQIEFYVRNPWNFQELVDHLEDPLWKSRVQHVLVKALHYFPGLLRPHVADQTWKNAKYDCFNTPCVMNSSSAAIASP